MRFHAPISKDAPLDLPVAMAHFMPWFTVNGGDYPLSPTEEEPLTDIPEVPDRRHWDNALTEYKRTHLYMPEIGVYDSRDPAAIQWQIKTALEYGISGFIVNWYGKHSVENVITLHWKRGLQQWNAEHPDQPFYWFISFDSQAQKPTEGKKPVTMKEDFEYIRDYLVDDAYLRRDGRVIFSVFPYENNPSEWREALDSVYGQDGADLIWMNEPQNGYANACYPWIRPDDAALKLGATYSWDDPDNPGADWLRYFYTEASRPSHVEYVMAGVWPGFNDHLVSWAWNPRPDDPTIRPRVMCRETTNGNTLELTWEVYLDYLRRWAEDSPEARKPVPLIQLVTWNDHAEASTLEPTKDYGRAPLELCKRKLAEAREIWNKANAPTSVS